MQLIEISLKGFVGIKDGLGLDAITVDFRDCPPGMIVFEGDNGAGKTTLLDLLHPYLYLPYRNCSIADAVEKGGERNLVFEINNNTYRSYVKVKGKKTEAYLYRYHDDGHEELLADRVTDYEKKIDEILMPKELFFVSQFRAQNADSFADFKPVEFKKIFERILGISLFRNISELARQKAKLFQAEINGVTGEIKYLEDRISSIDIQAVNEELNTLKSEINVGEEIKATIEKRLSVLEKAEKKMAETKHNLLSQYRTQISTINERYRAGIKEIEGFTLKNKEYEKILAQKDDILQASLEIKKLDRAVDELEGLQEEVARHQERMSLLQGEQGDLKARISRLQAELKEAKKQSELLGGVSATEHLPCVEAGVENEGCQLLQSALEKIASVEEKEKEITELQNSLQNKVDEYRVLNKTILESKERLSRLNGLKKRYRDLQTISQKAEVLGYAEKEIEQNNLKIKAIKDENLKMNQEIEKLQKEIANVESKYNRVLQRIAEKKKTAIAEKDDVVQTIQSCKESIVKHQATIQGYKENTARLGELRKKEQELEEKAVMYNFIRNGFGMNGLIAYEIDISLPHIVNIANAMLEQMGMGERVFIQMRRQLKSDKNRYKEDFKVGVVTGNGNIKLLNDLSGGERVWIDEVIAKAISAYMNQRYGNKVRTFFSDERDGALSMTRKAMYVQMKLASLKIGGWTHEIVISHSPMITEKASAVFRFVKGKGIVKEFNKEFNEEIEKIDVEQYQSQISPVGPEMTSLF